MSGSSLRPITGFGFGGNPLETFQQLRQEMDRVFGQYGLPTLSGQQQRGLHINPPIEIAEDNEGYHITLELPGIEQQQVEINLTGSTLKVQAERHEHHQQHHQGGAQAASGQSGTGQPQTQTQTAQQGRHVLISERSYGRIERTFELPADIDASRADAQFRNGLLTITLPKSAQSRDQHRRIEIKS